MGHSRRTAIQNGAVERWAGSGGRPGPTACTRGLAFRQNCRVDWLGTTGPSP